VNRPGGACRRPSPGPGAPSSVARQQHGEEEAAFDNAGYQGVYKRPEAAGPTWHATARRHSGRLRWPSAHDRLHQPRVGVPANMGPHPDVPLVAFPLLLHLGLRSAAMGDARQFSNPEKLVGYLGLSASVLQSGNAVAQPLLSRH
jgi:hypothetical protein